MNPQRNRAFEINLEKAQELHIRPPAHVLWKWMAASALGGAVIDQQRAREELEMLPVADERADVRGKQA